MRGIEHLHDRGNQQHERVGQFVFFSICVDTYGYVGLSNAMLLSQHYDAVSVDIIEEKVKLLNDKLSPIVGVDNLNDYYDVSLKKARVNRIQHDNFKLVELDIADHYGVANLFEVE